MSFYLEREPIGFRCRRDVGMNAICGFVVLCSIVLGVAQACGAIDVVGMLGGMGS